MKAYLCAGAALLATTAIVVSQQSKTSVSAERAANRLRKAITSEVKALPNHPWAGEYYSGDGLGVNVSLSIAPKSGFVFEWHGCMGLYDRNYGNVSWTNDRIHLSFTFANEREGFQGLAPEFIPIRWGERHYLVPAEDVIGFCNHVNDGSEPRQDLHGFYLLRSGDEKKPVSGIPDVPAEFKTRLLSEPITAEIIEVRKFRTRPSVADWKVKDTTVVLNVGTNKRLQVGMQLVVTDPRNLFESVQITRVEESRAEGVMTQIGEESVGPQVGWRLSTRPPWR